MNCVVIGLVCLCLCCVCHISQNNDNQQHQSEVLNKHNDYEKDIGQTQVAYGEPVILHDGIPSAQPVSIPPPYQQYQPSGSMEEGVLPTELP